MSLRTLSRSADATALTSIRLVSIGSYQPLVLSLFSAPWTFDETEEIYAFQICREYYPKVRHLVDQFYGPRGEVPSGNTY